MRTFSEEEVEFLMEKVREIGNTKTNADHIRAMSDEELAEFLSVRCNIGIEFVKCWLRAEVEGT